MSSHPAPEATLVWYVSYGSNLAAVRLGCYLAGGTPPGATRAYPGARDRTPPRQARGVWLPGGVFFALDSRVWSGGVAFYDPTLAGRAAARAYLVTAAQFADVAAQEMGRAPGGDLDLDPVLRAGSSALGPGRYETLLHVGDLDGYPMLTFTAPFALAQATPTTPSAAYLRMLALGLAEAHGWGPAQTARYLSGRPGAAPAWSATDLLDLCCDVHADGPAAG